MGMQFRKISNYGVSHPVVARLFHQPCELITYLSLTEADRDRVITVYKDLTERMHKCFEAFGRLKLARDKAFEAGGVNGDARVENVPYIIGLEGEVETILYEAKNYLRVLTQVVNVFWNTNFNEASHFGFKRKKDHTSDGQVVLMAKGKWGEGSEYTRFFVSVQKFVEMIIPKRNAVEHPNGHSGTLNITNYQKIDGKLYEPCWYLNEDSPKPVFEEIEIILENLIRTAEELLVVGILSKQQKSLLGFVEIPEEERNPECPVRLTVTLRIPS